MHICRIVKTFNVAFSFLDTGYISREMVFFLSGILLGHDKFVLCVV